MKRYLVVHAHAINGIFRIGEHNIDYHATQRKHLQVAIAFWFEDIVRLKYVFSVIENVVLHHPLDQILPKHQGAYKMPTELDLQTALVIGIDQSSAATFTLNGNEIGKIDFQKNSQNELLDSSSSRRSDIDSAAFVIGKSDESSVPCSTSHSFEGSSGTIDSSSDSSDNAHEEVEKQMAEKVEKQMIDYYLANLGPNSIDEMNDF